MSSSERLQPALLDRLTDSDPERKVETRDQRIMSIDRLRGSVRRDLGFLLSTAHLEALVDLSEAAEVRRSVLNYGIPNIAGTDLAGVEAADIERAVRDAILQFEPRLLAKTLEVSLEIEPGDMHRNAMVFRIQADLRIDKEIQPVLWKSELDLDTGNVDVREGD